MTERWQRELKKLRQLEPPSTTWSHVEEGPKGDGPEASGARRLMAGVVAFVVFAAAGVLAWTAFGPGSDQSTFVLGEPEQEQESLIVSLLAGPDQPTGTLRFGSRTEPLRPLGFDWSDGNSSTIADAAYPEFRQADFLAIPAGTLLQVQGDAQSVRGHLGPPSDPFAFLQRLGVDDGSTPLALDPGKYIVVLEAVWPQGSAPFLVPIQVVRPPEASASPSVSPDGQIPSVAVIRCTDTGTEVLTSVVRSQADGVHFQVDNQSQVHAIAGWRTADKGPGFSHWASEFGRMNPAPMVVLSLRPNQYFVQCVRGSTDSDRIDLDPKHAQPLEIVDVDAGASEQSSSPVIGGYEAVPDVLRIICESSGTQVLTPVVRVQPDGLHVLVEDRAGVGNVLIRPSDPIYGDEVIFSSGSRGVDAQFVDEAVPGTAEIVCQGDDIREGHVDELPWVPFQIIDPEGYFVSYGLGCGSSGRHHVSVSGSHSTSAEEFVRSGLAGVLPTDRVEPAGYADGRRLGAWIRVVRDGSTVASLLVSDEGNRPELRDGFACDGSGIG
jgi:hypothetical protein